jgi:hypothetical protein
MLNLVTFNRWWDTGKVEDIYLKPYKRPLFFSLKKFLNIRQILLIYGIRRVGKTTLLYQLIDFLLKKGIDKRDILYFSFDEKIASLEELFKNYSELVLGEDILKRKRIYIFLDEIQKLDNWKNQLKIFYDLYPNVKFIISGSASLVISKGAKESLAGRVYEFVLPLLNFSEFLKFLGEEIKINNIFDIRQLREIYLKKERLSPLFFSYLKNGGFIEIASEKDELKIKEYSKSILEKVIFGDIALSFKVRQPQVLRVILELVASNPGFLLDYSKLAETLSKDQRVIADYIFYLKYSLLVKVLYNFSSSRFASERKLKKIYLNSTNFIYQFYPGKFRTSEFIGKIIENLVVSFENSHFFWRKRQNEVDLVLKEDIPLEIKYKGKVTKSDLKGVLKFVQKFNSKKAIILTKDELKIEKNSGIQFYFIPVWMYLLK